MSQIDTESMIGDMVGENQWSDLINRVIGERLERERESVNIFDREMEDCINSELNYLSLTNR
jgi:hypothetical protein